MCRKRLHITQDITSAEFVAGGRIWWTRIHMGPEGRWRMSWGLSQHSLPARPNAVVLIKAHIGKPGCATPPQELRLVNTLTDQYSSLVPEELESSITKSCCTMAVWLGDWLMNENTVYLDSDGTLHAKLEITLQ
ncbi:hypothetical protein K503DRAFT_165155 [Rhizopogon vinicolor AM-OR11-026]|uniref:Uncharacterized protein n=1 Tax=Rhizopogon vinicolor AM-OR11-026 TaxID=1314800 RepID=A0A1B7N0H1_9AGAM|nr:hypothetical protein K503DRAFT_165155 [Rhizopogon vinicolor AM-OR11-026]